jgi:hypothetical protein
MRGIFHNAPGVSRLAVTAALALNLAACATPTKAIQALPEADVSRIGVGKVSFVYNVPGTTFASTVTQDFKHTLEGNIEGAVRACATGDLVRDLLVSIDYYRRADPALTVLVGDSNQLHGTASFLQSDNQSVLGKYSVTVAEGGGGLLGVALMANGNERMTREFGVYICTDILKRTAPSSQTIKAQMTTPAPAPAPAAAAVAAPPQPVAAVATAPAAKPAPAAVASAAPAPAAPVVPEGTRMSKPIAD